MITKYDVFEHIWLNPRETFRYLWDCPPSFHMSVFIGITCLYTLFLAVLCSASINDLPFLFVGVSLGLFGIMGFLLLPLASLCAKIVGGKSMCVWILSNCHKNLPKLFIGFIWTFSIWVPAAFLALVALVTARYMPIPIILLSMALVVFLYGLFVLAVAISEAKNLGLWQAFLVLFFAMGPIIGLTYGIVQENIRLNEWRRLDKEDYFHQAAAQGDTERIKWFLESGADVNQRNKNGLSPLFFACMLKSPESAQLLIENGASVNLVAMGGRTPLIVATMFECTKVVELLLHKDAELDHKNNEGQTALMLAAKRGNRGIAKLLLEKSAQVHNKDDQGATALHYAADRGRTLDPGSEEIINLLLDKGAKVNHQDKYGRTALHKAVINQNKEIVWFLLCRGADVNQKDARGKTSLYFALNAGRYRKREIEDMLRKFGAREQ